MNRFSNIISDCELNEATAPLPLVHTTSAYSFRQIMSSMRLTPFVDKAFNEEVLYFYYGKPSFYPKTENSSSFNHNFQVFFVFNPNALTAARRVFPFDSGAFSGGLYTRYFSKHMSLTDFQIELDDAQSGGTPFPITAQKIVASIYGSNERYFRSAPRSDLTYSVMDFELEGYLELIRNKANDEFDDRRSVIEIQSTREMPLNRETLEAMIVPSALLDSDEFQEFIAQTGLDEITLMTYNHLRSKPEYFAALATERVGSYLETKGYL